MQRDGVAVERSPMLSERAVRRAHDRAAEAPKWETPEVLAAFLAAQDREELARVISRAVFDAARDQKPVVLFSYEAAAILDALLGPVA